MRAQTSLPALGVAFLVLTAGVVIGITTAGAALDTADRRALERQAAVGLSERLVGEGSRLTTRANVLNGSELAGLTVTEVRERYGLSADVAVRVALEDRLLVSAGDPSGGTTVERLVLVERRKTRTLSPSLDRGRTVTLPRRTSTVTLTLRPPATTRLQTVRINGRVRLHNASGLNGTYDIPVSPIETARLRFDALGPLDDDSVTIRYRPTETEKARLRVTVDE